MIRQPGFIHKQTDTEIQVFVTEQIKSLNQFLPSESAMKNHKSAQREYDYLAKRWKQYKWNWVKALNIFPQKEREKYKVDCTIVSERTRLIDIENLYGGAKPIRDYLEKRGWIWNDGPGWGDCYIKQRRCSKDETGTWIRLVLHKD